MIMHVARAGEQRGRVVLQLRTANPSRYALEAAVRVARAFESELESLFIQDEGVINLACFPFAREISASGLRTRTLSLDEVEKDMRLSALALSRRLEDLARRAEVPLICRVVRDEPVHALAVACAEHGPWNVVALGDTALPTRGEVIAEMFETIAGTTGLILVGPMAKRSSGPIVAAVESDEALPVLLKVAQRLSSSNDLEVVIVPIGNAPDILSQLDEAARLAMADSPHTRIVTAEATHGAPEAVAETLRRLAAGLVIGEFGGILVPDRGDLRHLSRTLECPLFLMR